MAADRGRRPRPPAADLPRRVRSGAAARQPAAPGLQGPARRTRRRPRLRAQAAAAAPGSRAPRGRGRRLLPHDLTRLHSAGGRDGPPDPRPAHRRGPGHRRGDRTAPGQRRGRRHGPDHRTDDLCVGAQGVTPGPAALGRRCVTRPASMS
ncbi:hypothetical protein SGPA1_31395 [Streptomyces misionensis JCM 4497]